MFKRIMIITTVISGLLFAAAVTAQVLYPQGWLLTVCITCGTVFYHFAMRMAVGTVYHAIFHNHIRYTHRWFQPRRFEKRLYALLRVKRWKHVMPTYDPHTFDPKQHTLDELAQAMCQSELVHETIAVLSFLPLLMAIPFGEFWVFLFTSLGAALFYSFFIVLQRYNRPRVLRLMKRKK